MTFQKVSGKTVTEIGYLFDRSYWHKGYAIEAAQACKSYAFNILGVNSVCSLIREDNIPSMNVAIRNGMTIRTRELRTRWGAELFYYIFAIDNLLSNE